MVTAELSRTVLELPVEDRLELARQLIESVAPPAPLLDDGMVEAVKRIEDLVTGKVRGLTEEEFYAALNENHASTVSSPRMSKNARLSTPPFPPRSPKDFRKN
jgi:putative addiction module component (TIGR02574 family)